MRFSYLWKLEVLTKDGKTIDAGTARYESDTYGETPAQAVPKLLADPKVGFVIDAAKGIVTINGTVVLLSDFARVSAELSAVLPL